MADVTAIVAQLQALTTLPDLKGGSSGDAVKALQAALNTMGLSAEALKVDGAYGPNTNVAVGALRGMFSLGIGDFDSTLKSALATDLAAGPNAASVLRALSASGGVVPAVVPQISLDDLASAVTALAEASVTGVSPTLLSVQIALAFLNYYPASMVGSNDAAAQTAFAQALLAFARNAFSNPQLNSTQAVDAGELYSRLSQALQGAVAAKGGTLPDVSSGGAGATAIAILTHPATVIVGGTALLYWGSKRLLRHALFGVGEGYLEGMGGVGDGYGYELDSDENGEEEEVEDEFEDEPAPAKAKRPATIAGMNLHAYEVPRHGPGRRAAMKGRRGSRAPAQSKKSKRARG